MCVSDHAVNSSEVNSPFFPYNWKDFIAGYSREIFDELNPPQTLPPPLPPNLGNFNLIGKWVGNNIKSHFGGEKLADIRAEKKIVYENKTFSTT